VSAHDCQRGLHVITAFVRHEGDLLVVQRKDDHSSPDRWDAVSRAQAGGAVDPVAVARDAVAQIGIADATLVRRGDPVPVDARNRSPTPNNEETHFGEWEPTAASNAVEGRLIHPLLFAVETREVSLSAGTAEWLPAPEIRRRPTVPYLWCAYRRIAPTAETIEADTDHGSAWISIRALEVLRDRAAVADGWQPVVEVAHELRAARPDMAALHNRINRALARAGDDDADERTDTDATERTPSAAVAATQRTLVEAVHADERAAQRAAALLDSDATVGTLSRSGTVIDALVQADSTVVIGESRPAGEGGDVAAALADRDMTVTLTTDAALSSALSGTAELSIDVVLVGADAVLPDGSIINKVGTRALSLAAAESAVPLYVVAASDKVALEEYQPTERSDPTPLDPAPGVETWVPTFDRTPPAAVDGIVTEEGVLAPAEIEAVTARHRRHANWVNR
jgi:translation initiation factor 2B subunit (eIF-2B alpha/beta/delta family)